MYYNQTTASANFTDQLYLGGRQSPASLFDDFENWRSGTFGWRHRAHLIREEGVYGRPRGAHFSPFAFMPLGPTVLDNQGLVLDNTSQQAELERLKQTITAYQLQINFMQANVETAVLDASFRARIDVKTAMLKKINETQARQHVVKQQWAQLAVSQCATNTTNCTLHFNTTAATLVGAITVNGTVTLTPQGTEVVVFAFDSIQLGSEVKVTLSGQRALVLLSRSSVVINTTFVALPGTYGGFPGGFSVARVQRDQWSDHPRHIFLRDIKALNGTPSNNINGPGSGSVRVYLYTITTASDNLDEVQRISTFARRGQTIRGTFTIQYKNYTTRPIPCDATAAQVKSIMEGDLNTCDPYNMRQCDALRIRSGVGMLNVSRGRRSDEGGYDWTITFRTATGDVPQITAKSALKGVGSGIRTITLKDGNSMGGYFTLSFLNQLSRPLPYDINSTSMESALREDFTDMISVKVIRTNPTSTCQDGMCQNGPTPGGGYEWTLTMLTETGNISPTSPTAPEAQMEGAMGVLEVQGYLSGQGSRVWVTAGHSQSINQQKRWFNATRPFSLAFGGGGGAYGGDGGPGYGENPLPKVYGDQYMSDLLGGSGGAMGDVNTAAINAYMYPQARGGAGGGAIEVVAINDITIGSQGKLLMDAEDGSPGNQYGGGGGSGGAVLLSAGGAIYHEGVISTRGGHGGVTNWPTGNGGGGGSGGRVAMYAQSVTVAPSSVVDVQGGVCPTPSGAAGLEAGVCSRHGSKGSFYVWSKMGCKYYVDERGGAAGTSRSLYLTSDERTTTISGAEHETPFPREGPEYKLAEGKPERVTFYIKLGGLSSTTPKSSWNWGAMFALLTDHDDPRGVASNTSIGLGVSFTDTVQHGVDFYYVPSEDSYPPYLARAKERVSLHHWYKVDILLFWATQRYDLRIDDVTYVRQAVYTAKSFQRIGLYSFPRGEVWFDEIFAGVDVSMSMQCPLISSTGVSMDRPLQNSWPADAIGGSSFNHPMTRWLSHIGVRNEYSYNNGGLVPFDGEAHEAYRSDIKMRFTSGDKHITQGKTLRCPSRELPIMFIIN